MQVAVEPVVKQNHRQGLVYVDSREVAKCFNKRHSDVLRDTNNIVEDDDFSRRNFALSKYKMRGKDYPCFHLTKDGFSLLVMGYTGSKAREFKIAFIQRFNEMEEYVRNLDRERQEAKVEHRRLALTLRDSRAEKGKDTQPFHYSNETDLINRIVLGTTSKKYRAMRGIGQSEPIRDYLFPAQISAILDLQSIDIALIRMDYTFKQRKEILTEQFCKAHKDELIEQHLLVEG